MKVPGVALRNLEFGDILLSLYIVVFVRQYFWVIGNQGLAWFFTITATAILCWFFFRSKATREEPTPPLFWLIVALPLFLIYALRLAFPDLSFDVLNHRIIQSERALSGPLLLSGDFFPTLFPFNPSSDMLTGIFRHVLGYRLGTIVNYFALLWTGIVLNKLLAPFVEREVFRCFAILLVLFTEHILFEISTYMVDLLSLPLMLEATRLGLNFQSSANKKRDLTYGALLVGLCAGLKLTNLTIIVPIVLLFVFQFLSWKERGRLSAQLGMIVSAAGVFFLPLLAHAVYIYRLTASPVFPLYNKVFRSPYWANINAYDGRWGPHNWWETLTWPLLTLRQGARLSELNFYSGRICFGFVAAILCLVLPGVNRRFRLLAAIVVLGALLWSASSGYIRYALYLEIAGGVLLVYLSVLTGRLVKGPLIMRGLLATLPLFLLVSQSAFSFAYVQRTEWGGRPTLFDQPQAYRTQLKYLLRDRVIQDDTSPDRLPVDQIDAWIVSSVKTNGVEVLLRRDVPMISVNNEENFMTPKSRQWFAAAIKQLQDKRIYSLCLREDLEPALAVLKQRGLETGTITPVVIGFFSDYTQLHMFVIQVAVPHGNAAVQRPADYAKATQATGPLADDAFSAGLSAPSAPKTLRAGEKTPVNIVVQNRSNTMWPAGGQTDGKYFVTIANSWIEQSTEKLLTNMDGRSNLRVDLWPGDSQTVLLNITAPATPGEYVLEIDVVQEGVTWFKDRGSETLKIPIKVE